MIESTAYFKIFDFAISCRNPITLAVIGKERRDRSERELHEKRKDREKSKDMLYCYIVMLRSGR